MIAVRSQTETRRCGPVSGLDQPCSRRETRPPRCPWSVVTHLFHAPRAASEVRPVGEQQNGRKMRLHNCYYAIRSQPHTQPVILC